VHYKAALNDGADSVSSKGVGIVCLHPPILYNCVLTASVNQFLPYRITHLPMPLNLRQIGISESRFPTKQRCDKHDELSHRAQDVLQRIHKLTAKQKLIIAGSGVSERFLCMDRELELAMGEKERAIGALREHDEEHGCQADPAMPKPIEPTSN
jgi:hypothetical protein